MGGWQGGDTTHRPTTSLLPDEEFVPINNNPAPSLLPDQEFIPINMDASHFGSSLFSSPLMFRSPAPVFQGDGGISSCGSGNGLLADLHADSEPVENAAGRHKTEVGAKLLVSRR